jgi:hypothetical protein
VESNFCSAEPERSGQLGKNLLKAHIQLLLTPAAGIGRRGFFMGLRPQDSVFGLTLAEV